MLMTTPSGFNTLRHDGFVLDDGVVLPTRARSAAHAGEALYGVRPEHFALDPDGVTLTVQVIEPTGAETQVMASLAGQSVIAVFRERIAVRPGETLRVSLRADQAHLFDAASGARIDQRE